MEPAVGGDEAAASAFWMPSKIELARLLVLPPTLPVDRGIAKDEKVGECGGDWAEISDVNVSRQVAVVNNRSGGWMDGWG